MPQNVDMKNPVTYKPTRCAQKSCAFPFAMCSSCVSCKDNKKAIPIVLRNAEDIYKISRKVMQLAK